MADRLGQAGEAGGRRRQAGSSAALVLLGAAIASAAPARAAGRPDGRAVLLVRVPQEPAWREMAFLAAVPAMTVAGDAAPAVIALGKQPDLPAEVADYFRRYKPRAVYLLGPKGEKVAALDRPCRALVADSADAAACVLARTFWTKCETAVVCRDDEYAAGLVAAPVAARLRAPLLFAGRSGLSAEAVKALKRLGAKRAVLVGNVPPAVAGGLKKRGTTVVQLADAKAVGGWLVKQGLPVRYVAAVNVTDRSRTVIKKLSLAAALLAAGRGGMVLPLDYDVRWKAGFAGADCGKQRPKGIPASKQPPRKGLIELGGRKLAFVVTGEPKGRRCRLGIDFNGNGTYGEAGEGPLCTGDVVTVAGKRYAVTLGQKNGAGKADVRLTWPTAERVRGDLRRHYKALGGPPEHLCLVGFPDAIPQAIVTHSPGATNDLPSDLPYANADDDPFAEIALARLIGESATAATLYASRVITCDRMAEGDWRRHVGEARWENTYSKLFENVGFRPSLRHDRDDLKWLVKPAGKSKGKRARQFDQSSPLTGVAAMTHMAHSWWKDLGQTYTWDSTVLLAPTLVESGGCLTAALDKQADCRSVIARLLRNGAVGFVGNARPGIAHQEQLRLEFWNGVLAGRTIGQAHRASLNSMAVTVLETGQHDSGPDRYQLYIRTLFGDPAFAMRIPSAPRSAPARVTVKGDMLSVHAPATWWPVKIRVPEDWKKWADKDLYVCRGAGTYPLRTWCKEQYDRETTFFNAELTTKRRVKSIRQVQSPAKPLGWRGKHFVDEHADGTRTYRWRVQLIDFDQITGKIRGKVDRIDYRIEWDDA